MELCPLILLENLVSLYFSKALCSDMCKCYSTDSLLFLFFFIFFICSPCLEHAGFKYVELPLM